MHIHEGKMHADRDCIGLLPGASQEKLNSRAPDRIQFESTTMSLAFNEILLPYFFTLKMCGHAERDLINKLQICC